MRLMATRPNTIQAQARTLAIGFLVFLAPLTARGQYTLTWSAVSGGGGLATGGSSYVLIGSIGNYAALDDSSTTSAPAPDPMQWATVPYATSSSKITMMAAEAQDPNGGVQYYFQNVTVSGHDSGWQEGRTFTDQGLSPGTVYEYRVRSRGLMRVEGEYSVALSARTEAEPNEQVPEGSAEPVSGGLGNDLNLQVDPFTGSVGYTLPIAVPPGRQGSEPSLALRYGGGGNGWCGFGWSLGMGAIQRDTRKGVPVARSGATFQNKYDDDKGFVVAFGAVNSRLARVSDTNEYRAETDQAFLKYVYDPNGDPNGLWTVTDKSGNKFYFGEVTGEGRTAGAVMVHPQFSSAAPGDNAFLWALAKIQDINGNLTYVFYTQDANQVYLDEIRYNGHTQSLSTSSSVKFVLDPNERSDKSISYATGYRVETNKRLSEIGAYVYDYNEADWVRVRGYHLTYGQSPSTLRSLLTSIRVCGAGDPNDPNSYLPPVTFEYQQKPFEFERDANGDPVLRDWGSLDSQYGTTVGFTGWYNDGTYSYSSVGLYDINGDGLPDRVLTNTTSNPWNPSANPPGNVLKVQLNTGSGFSSSLVDWGPADAQGSTGQYVWNANHTGVKEPWPGGQDSTVAPTICGLADINGDGFLDRVAHRNTVWSASYAPAQLLNYFYVQCGTGFGFERTGDGSGGGTDFVTHQWGPLDLQGFTGTYYEPLPYPLGDPYSQGYFWSALDGVWEDDSYNITRLATLDINGDGLPDRVMQGIDGQYWDTYDFLPGQGENLFRVQLNTGSGFERTGLGSGGGTDHVTIPWGPVDSQGVTGTTMASHAWNAVNASTGGGTFVGMADINGDGLPDRVMRKFGSPYSVLKVQFNTGYGFERTGTGQGGGTDFVTRDWGPLNSQGQTSWPWGCTQASTSEAVGSDDFNAQTYMDFFDINGDGLPDRVMRKVGSPFTALKVELNTGTGFTHQIDGNDIEWLGVTSPSRTDSIWWGGTSFGYGDTDDGVITYQQDYLTMCDINGDGLPDRVMWEVAAGNGGDPTLMDVHKVQLNKGPFPDLLRKVKGGLGGSAEVTYKPSTQYDNRDHEGKHRLAFPVQTASSLTVDDGLGHRSTTTYEYSRGYFDGQEREFRGFGKVKVTDPAGAMSITYFHQGGGYEDPNAGEYEDAGSVAKKGMPYRVEVYGSDSNLYAITFNKVEESKIDPSADWYYAYVSQTTKLEYAAAAYEPGSTAYPTGYRAKVRQSVYDIANKTGNILKSIDVGEVSLGNDPNTIATNVAAHTYTNLDTADDLYIHTTYATITGHPEIVNKIATTKTTSDLAGSSKLKEIVFTYDTLGRVVTEQTWLDKTKAGSANRYTTTSQYGYDGYGNRSYSIDKAGIRTDTTYDTNYQMYPVTKTTGTFVTSIDYDVRSGLPTRTVDPAGMVALNTYDSFFRLTDAMASTEPNGQPDLWLTHIDYNLGGITDEVSSNYVHQVHEGYEAYTYNDGLGRVVQTRTKAEDGAAGEYRVVHTCYDVRGNVEFQTLPFWGDDPNFTPPYSYNLYLGTSTPLGSGSLVGNTVSTHFDPNTLNFGTTYYWRLDKIGATGQVLATGDTWSFTTETQAQSEWRDPENPASTLSGLDYARCNGQWDHIPDFDTMVPIRGTVTTFSLSPFGTASNFAVRYTGYITIDTGGVYTFYTASNDGSRLYIGDTLVVNNDGYKWLEIPEQSGTIALKPGKHRITVEYFDKMLLIACKSLTVSYKAPGGSKVAIPAGVLYHDDPNAPVTPGPYHAEPSVSTTPRLVWEGCITDADWDDAQAGVRTEYDAMGRAWKVTPAGDDDVNSPTGPSTTVYNDANDPWGAVDTDANGKVTRTRFDASGRVIRLSEITSGGSIVTRYVYDRLGRLLQTIDDANNVFQAEYDSLDRKIRSIDPDMGTWTYEYDDSGRMTRQTDARSNKVEFTYETGGLGRVTQKLVKNSGGSVVETIGYTYDASDDPGYTVHKGQLYKVTDGQGWTKTGCDSQGRAIKSSRYLTETGETYTTHTAYDVADRVIQVTYPDTRAVVAYDYDKVGHLTTVRSLWGTTEDVNFYEASGFNEMHQETSILYGNGRTTQYEYYGQTRRLKRMTTTGVGSTIQDIRYTYDMASNILSVTDAIHTGDQSCGLSNIEYDDLYRLTDVNSAAQGVIAYEYTGIGNISKNGEMGTGSYAYAGSGHSHTQPHAVTSANGSTYLYDACGNMTTRNRSGQPGQTLTYDEQNRLKQVAITGGDTITYGYSAGGTRLWKKVNGHITNLWIGSLYEEKDNTQNETQILCHVYAGDRLVTTFEPAGTFTCLIERNRYFAALWHAGDKTLSALFGGGRAPVTILWAGALTGIALGIRYNRRRLQSRYGLDTYYGLRFIGGTDPWRQMVLLTLAASIFISGTPAIAQTGTPEYDPIFYYYHPDHLGSSQIMTDSDGDVVRHYGYSPFGRDNGPDPTPAFHVSSRYTGQTLDEETGLYYYGARYYDPELARFIQPDSTIPDPEFSQAYNRYAYVYNNPLKFSDPSGQNPLIVAAIIMAAKTAAVSACISAVVAAVTGGDVGKAFISGLIAGFCGALGGIPGAIAGGALGALATGGDPLQGALSAGVAVGVQVCLGFSPSPSGADFLSGEYLKELALSTASGALCGGVTAEIMGGDFSEGAASGAAAASANFIVSSALDNASTEGDAQNDSPLPVADSPSSGGGIPGPLGMVARAVDIANLGPTDAIPHSTADEGIIAYRAMLENEFKIPAGYWQRLGGAVRAGVTRGHHSVPKAIFKRLPKEVANDPLVRGAAGKRNIWEIPESLHKVLHGGGPKGGVYNKFWHWSLDIIEKQGRTPTVESVQAIRTMATRVFELGAYAPK